MLVARLALRGEVVRLIGFGLMVEQRNKGRRRKKLSIFVCCGLALVLLLTFWREREPQYKGRSLTQWAVLLNGGYANEPNISQRDAQEAIRSIGTNGLPFYVKWYQYQERPWRTRLANQAARLPGEFGRTARNLVLGHGELMQQAAISGFSTLGPNAKPALPFLTQQLAGPSAEFAMQVIGNMGDVGLPTILAALTNGSPTALRCRAIWTLSSEWNRFSDTNVVQSVVTAYLQDPDREVSLSAAEVLCTHKIAQDRAMQVFAEALQSNNSNLCQHAGILLSMIPRRSFSAATLVQYLQDTNSPLSLYAADALGGMAQINANLPENVLPALTNSLNDPRPKVRLNAAAALGYFRNAPEIVGPALLDAFQDPDQSVRRAATNSFFGLAPYYVLNTVSEFPIQMSREQAYIYVKRYGAPANTSMLTRLLDHPDIRIREMATNTFRTLREVERLQRNQ